MTKQMNIAVWIAQVLLAVVFAVAGVPKAFLAPNELYRMMPDLAALPLPFVRFIGIAELAAVAGLILPWATKIAPMLTPLAAARVIAIMAGAFVFSLKAGHFASLPLVVIVTALAWFVIWGRFTRAEAI